MARYLRELAALLSCHVFCLASACTVFNGLSVPQEETCDPEAVASDPDNCGACGHDCAGGSCVDGACQPVVVLQVAGTPVDLAVDGDHVFFTTREGTVGRVAKDGSDYRAIASGIPGRLSRIALDASRVYFTASEAGIVYSAAKDGSDPITIATDQPTAGAIASDGSAAYWATNEGTNWGWIGRAPSGGSAAPLWENREFLEEIAVDAASLFWT